MSFFKNYDKTMEEYKKNPIHGPQTKFAAEMDDLVGLAKPEHVEALDEGEKAVQELRKRWSK